MKLKYIEIKDYLLKLMNAGKDQEILPSENDLCKYMNASRVTVRRALDELEHEGLIKRQKGKGAFICKTFPKNKSLNIFLGISKEANFASISNIMAGVLDQMKENGGALHIFTTNDNMNGTLQNIQNHNIDGIIGMQPNPIDYPIYEELRQRGYPVLLVNRELKNSHYSYVSFDFTEAAFLATDHLLNQGHEKIMLLGTSAWIPYSEYIKNGFEKAFKKHNTPKANSQIINIDKFKSEESFLKDMNKVFKDEFARLQPTAITCGELFFTRLVYPLLQEKHLIINKDIEVALCSKTLENTPLRNSIHEIRFPEYELGKSSIKSLVKMIKGESNKETVIIPVEFLKKGFQS